MGSMENADLVRNYLRGKNLEQLGRVEEAVEQYEGVVAQRFDSTGPYDRLIAIYAHQARHLDVIRVAHRALENVRTHADKHTWYEQMRREAELAATRLPKPVPKKSSA
jgi:hypothetical protein